MSDPSPLSLNRLRDAFAAMLKPHSDSPSESGSSRRDELSPSCEISPRSVVEAMLFVGRPDNGPMSARELAAAMRGVSPAEIDHVIAELNGIYERDDAPYRIIGSSNGYRLALQEKFGRMRDKYYGRIREAKLSPAALEVLAVVAYNQPSTAEEIDRLRGRTSGAVLSTLVRRQLVRLDRPSAAGQPPRYSTTERFLRLFGLENLAALPRGEELGSST